MVLGWGWGGRRMVITVRAADGQQEPYDVHVDR